MRELSLKLFVTVCRAFHPFAGADWEVGGSSIQHSVWTALVRGSDWPPSNRYYLRFTLLFIAHNLHFSVHKIFYTYQLYILLVLKIKTQVYVCHLVSYSWYHLIWTNVPTCDHPNLFRYHTKRDHPVENIASYLFDNVHCWEHWFWWNVSNRKINTLSILVDKSYKLVSSFY